MRKVSLVVILILVLNGLAYSQESTDKEFYKNGQLKYELIVNKVKDRETEGVAVAKGYYENGRLEFEIIAKDGNLEYGIYKDYYKNGKLKALRSFKNDEYHGIYISYNENGQLVFIGIYEDGKLIDWKDYHKDEESGFWG